MKAMILVSCVQFKSFNFDVSRHRKWLQMLFSSVSASLSRVCMFSPGFSPTLFTYFLFSLVSFFFLCIKLLSLDGWCWSTPSFLKQAYMPVQFTSLLWVLTFNLHSILKINLTFGLIKHDCVCGSWHSLTSIIVSVMAFLWQLPTTLVINQNQTNKVSWKWSELATCTDVANIPSFQCCVLWLTWRQHSQQDWGEQYVVST